MGITLGAYLESIANPAGRFLTLEGMWPVTDSGGRPIYRSGSRVASFLVSWNDRQWLLHCPLTLDSGFMAAAEKRALRTLGTENSMLARCDYRRGELLVFDTAGKSRRADVILEEVPEGETLRGFVRGRLFVSDRQHFRELLRGVAEFGASLHKSGLTHGNLRAEHIVVEPRRGLVATHYALSCEDDPKADISALATLALAVFIAGCEPRLHNIPEGADIFSPRHVVLNAEEIRTQAEFLRNGLLAALAEAAVSPAGVTAAELERMLREISRLPFAPLPLLAGLLEEKYGQAVAAGHSIVPFPVSRADDSTILVDFSRCEEVAGVHDSLVRFREREGWDYADRYGRRITSRGFLDARDFYEGRAAVETSTGWGLIDRQGRDVMPATFEMLEWYGPANVAAACSEGKWELYDRDGRQLTSGAYDWLGDCREGILLVRRGNRFGYLMPSGEQLTGIIFEDAYSFRNGRGMVSTGKEIYYIDRKGSRIE